LLVVLQTSPAHAFEHFKAHVMALRLPLTWPAMGRAIRVGVVMTRLSVRDAATLSRPDPLERGAAARRRGGERTVNSD
jgi:hypothetical protein